MYVALLAALVLINAAFAMSEIALVSVRKIRLEQEAARGDRRAAMALALSSNPTRFLSIVQVGITLIGILAGAIGEQTLADDVSESISGISVLAPFADGLAIVIVVLAIGYFSLIFGELVPKRMAMTRPEAFAKFFAPPMLVISVVAAPLIKLLTLSTDLVLWLLRVSPPATESVSEEDVKAMIEKGTEEGVFEESEQAIVQRVFRLGDLPVGALMVPRSEIVWLNESESADRIRVVVATEPFSHFPVCRKGLDDIVGVVHVKDMVRNGLIVGGDIRLAELVEDPIFVPATTPALRVLDGFRESRNHVAFVVDEYGVLKGLVTLNDLLQAIVGDLSREGEPEAPSAIARGDGTWLVDGRLTIRGMLDALEIELDDDDLPSDVHTVGGLVLSSLGRGPATGEIASWRELTLEVVDMDGQRVDKVLVSRVAPGEPTPLT